MFTDVRLERLPDPQTLQNQNEVLHPIANNIEKRGG